MPSELYPYLNVEPLPLPLSVLFLVAAMLILGMMLK